MNPVISFGDCQIKMDAIGLLRGGVTECVAKLFELKSNSW